MFLLGSLVIRHLSDADCCSLLIKIKEDELTVDHFANWKLIFTRVLVSYLYIGSNMHLYYLHASMCVCQLLRPDEKSTSTQRYIDSRTVQPKAKGSWISVDVTETIKDWVSDPGEVELVCKPNL